MKLRATIDMAVSVLAEVRETAAMVRALAGMRIARKGTPIDRSAPPVLMTVAEALALLGVNDEAGRAWLQGEGLIITVAGARRVHLDRLLAAIGGDPQDGQHFEAAARVPLEGIVFADLRRRR